MKRTLGISGGRRRIGAAALFGAALVVALMLGAVAPSAGGLERAPRRGDAGRVGISNFAFHPGTLRIERGKKVVFANNDSVTHTATGAGGSFDAGRIRPGHAAAIRFKRRGVFPYHCTIHRFMHGKIVVR